MKESLDDTSILIIDSDSDSFKLFLQYFYAQNPQITASNVGSLSYLASKYLVDGLQRVCNLFLTESISMHNVIPILESLLRYHQNVSCTSIYICYSVSLLCSFTEITVE